jgi:pilus assembly protein CpaF
MASFHPEYGQDGVPPPDKIDSGAPVRGEGDLSGAAVRDDGHLSLKRRLHQQLLATISAGRLERLSEPELRLELGRLVEELARQNAAFLELPEQEALVEQVLDEVFGYGPIEGLIRNHEISDILINGPRQVFIEKQGQLQATEVTFQDEAHLLQVVRRMIAGTGRRLDKKSPMVDARLPDGSRLNAVIKPAALNGPLVSIRRFGIRPLTVEDLLANESLTTEMLDFLTACVKGRINMIISGGSGSGKTTLLNALSRYIPHSERVVTVEDTAELEIQQPHVAKLEAQPADREGAGEVSLRELVKNSLRMRPDRIIVGECRGAESLEMLHAMNTGHDGSLTTIHANSSREALARVELMIGLAGGDIPVWAIRKLLASSVTLVVQVARLVGGKRKVVAISEITGIQGDIISMHDLFQFVQTAVDQHQAAEGYFRTTGIRPQCHNKLTIRGANVPLQLFIERRLAPQRNQEPGR